MLSPELGRRPKRGTSAPDGNDRNDGSSNSADWTVNLLAHEQAMTGAPEGAPGIPSIPALR